MMIRQLFSDAIAASLVLETDPELRGRLEKAMTRLPPTKVDSRTGELQEYVDSGNQVGDRAACELLSTWGLIWSDQLAPLSTPELCAAVRKAYEASDRRPWATGQVGSWQGAFPANTFARLGDGDRVAEVLARHFQKIVQGNLTAGFIQSEWQIDGNLGVMAAIGEMLLQSHEITAARGAASGHIISLLPALPRAWRNGAVKGLKARGGFWVDIDWKDGKVTHFHVASAAANAVTVRVNGELRSVTSERTP
jgi:alpha-L-fucosidase 2